MNRPDSLSSQSSGKVLHTLHTVWIYWSEDDAIELHGALDTYTVDNNYEAYAQMLTEAGEKVGKENVREIKVDVDWMDVCRAFEPVKTEGEVRLA